LNKLENPVGCPTPVGTFTGRMYAVPRCIAKKPYTG
jgi:hypothetical protein